MPSKTNTQKSKRSPSGYSGWMFARDFSKGVFSLLNTGKVYPAFGLLIIAIMGIAAWRLPPDQLATVIYDFLVTVRSSFGIVLVLFFITNAAWLWLFARQKSLYEKEIERLAKIRHDLVHNKELIMIENHRSSDEVTGKTHIFPEIKTARQQSK